MGILLLTMIARVYEFRFESQQWYQLGSDLKGDGGTVTAVGSFRGGDISSQPGKVQIFHFKDTVSCV